MVPVPSRFAFLQSANDERGHKLHCFSGAVRLGYRNELAAITDESEREATFQKMVDRMYEHGKALSVATHFEIDDVIDPADSRRWLIAVLGSHQVAVRTVKKRSNIDTW